MAPNPIESYRLKHGLTLETLGNILGVAGSTIWRWENNRRKTPKWALEAIKSDPIICQNCGTVVRSVQ